METDEADQAILVEETSTESQEGKKQRIMMIAEVLLVLQASLEVQLWNITQNLGFIFG